MPPQTDSNGNCLHAFGRGSFIALIVLVLPGILVWRYYDDIQASLSDFAEMPVFHELTGDFKTGAEIAGATFVRELREFYADTTWQENPAPVTRQGATYWHREQVEAHLRQKLGRRYQADMGRYLDYVEQYRDLAVAELQRSKIPASITLAQGILETNAGRSILATKANNHFGIKCRAKPGFKRDGVISDRDFDPHSLAYDCLQMTDDYTWDRFEMYPSARESFRRHSLLLQDRRYGWMLRTYEIGGIYQIDKALFGYTEVPYYAAWCVGLKKSGYATAKLYAEKLTLIIETYQLWKIDYENI